MTLESENILLLKSQQNNVASNIVITKKQSKSDISHIPRALWDKVIDFTDEPVVQCDILAVTNTSLDDDDDDDDDDDNDNRK